MNVRHTVGIPVSLVINALVFGAPMLAMGLSRYVEPLVFLETPAMPEYVAWFDPEGMIEGAGEEEAPPDAEAGEPEAVAEVEVPPAPAEEPPPPAEEVVEAPVVVEPPVEEVPPAATTEAPPTEDAPSSEVAAPATPARPPVAPGAPHGRPGTDGTAPPPPGKPGVDPTTVKDQGDPSAPRNRTTSCEEPHPQVEAAGEGLWIVQRDLIDYYTSSIAVFNTLGWSRKYEGEDGQKGWEIGGFGCKSPLWKAGLRSRDVVQSVNGKKTNNVVQIIGIWLGSKKKGDYEVKVLRKGTQVTLKYKVVD